MPRLCLCLLCLRVYVFSFYVSVSVYVTNSTIPAPLSGDMSRLQYFNHLVLVFGDEQPVEMVVTASTALDVPTKRVSVDATLTSPFPHWTRNSLKLR